jgi:hypothetical protein
MENVNNGLKLVEAATKPPRFMVYSEDRRRGAWLAAKEERARARDPFIDVV